MKTLLPVVVLAVFSHLVMAQEPLEKDVFKTSAGDVEITFIGHGSLMLKFNGKVIHVDPYTVTYQR